ncbi:hypothetical protein SKAU_G00078400 [Synaphobranchus kaupii]|uniref:Uncharacterized protein n=1 Tax=Synaphobranchus kaupii TaxID=118154 RepID=A0A9Q1FUI1_SYNKA|nr:hypothetical protein SKAU_G00078400 [Synaphobranchus kaupii]
MTGSSDGDSEADMEFQQSLAAGGKRGRPRNSDTGRGEEGRGAKVAREDIRRCTVGGGMHLTVGCDPPLIPRKKKKKPAFFPSFLAFSTTGHCLFLASLVPCVKVFEDFDLPFPQQV